MEEYINKAALVAWLKERIRDYWCDSYALEEVIKYVDTLEVKEVQESSAADRGMVDEIIFALNTLGKEKMISYDKEIEWLRNKT